MRIYVVQDGDSFMPLQSQTAWTRHELTAWMEKLSFDTIQSRRCIGSAVPLRLALTYSAQLAPQCIRYRRCCRKDSDNHGNSTCWSVHGERIGALAKQLVGKCQHVAIYASVKAIRQWSVPVVGAIAVWDGEYGRVAYVTDVQSETHPGIEAKLQTSKADCELPWLL